MPQPQSHLFEVELHLEHWSQTTLDLVMPVWTPGSYLIREYARHVQELTAATEEGTPLPWQKVSKNHWRITTTPAAGVRVRYRVFANDLTVRTNHLDRTHGYFNGAALFLYSPGWEKTPIAVTIVPPHPTWRVATPLPPDSDRVNTFIAPDFDTLVDSPFEIGPHQHQTFTVLGKPHDLVIWGDLGNSNPEHIQADMAKIIQVEADLFGGLPYDRYLFLLHLSANSYGGLEHKNACSLIYPRFGFQPQDEYNRFLQLVAHEFFHLWNVKRIRPKALETFDYTAENYTPSLWFAEGTTSYYDILLPVRAGLYNAKTCLAAYSKDITRLQQTPGRRVQPLSESSFDTWIKLYRPDANSANCRVSYYLKGELVTLLLDLLIRSRHNNQRSLDDVLRQLWQTFGQPEIGYTPEELQAVIESVAGMPLARFFADFIDGTVELPFDKYLQPFGLRLQVEMNAEPYLGITLKSEAGKEKIQTVEVGSPAEQAGLNPGDELLALNGIRVTVEKWGERLKQYAPGTAIQLTLFQQDELYTTTAILANPQPKQYQIVAVDNPTPAQQQAFYGWLGADLASLHA